MPLARQIVFIVVFSMVVLPQLVRAAGFDCNKASTRVEKLICSDDNLSGLDEDLATGYKQILNASTPEEKKLIVADQRKWLKEVRDRCEDSSCLSNAYYERQKAISSFDPFADDNITCEEMKKYPERIFSEKYIDLGSGHGSPIDVDYGCKGGLASLPYLQKLQALSVQIRSENNTGLCTGSIIYANWRYNAFDLLRAGLAPKVFLDQANDSQKPESIDAKLYPSQLYDNRLNYFEQWSWESPYNFLLHKEFFSEFDNDLPKLTKHYQESFGMSEKEASATARHALMLFEEWAAGTYPRYLIDEKLNRRPKVVELMRDDKSSIADLKAELLKGVEGQKTKIDAYYALKVALYHDRDQSFISALVEFIGSIDDAALNTEGEPALFAALVTTQYVPYLLDHGASVDVTNSFGKTALYYAIQLNDHRLVELLIDRGADVNHTYKSAKEINDPCGMLRHTKRTPLMHAAQNSDIDMIKLLVKHGARLNDVDEMSFSTLDYAEMDSKSENFAFLKSIGAKSGKSSQ